MGRYVNQIKGEEVPDYGKVNFILEKVEGSHRIPKPKQFVENLVCVVDNGLFEAAGYCYSPEEMEAFAYPDGRHKEWLIVPGAEELAP